MIALNCFESNVSADNRALINRMYRDEDEIDDGTDFSQLFNVFKSIKNHIKKNYEELNNNSPVVHEPVALQLIAESQQEIVEYPSASTANEISLPMTSYIEVMPNNPTLSLPEQIIVEK